VLVEAADGRVRELLAPAHIDRMLADGERELGRDVLAVERESRDGLLDGAVADLHVAAELRRLAARMGGSELERRRLGLARSEQGDQRHDPGHVAAHARA
jgi:hypothetical protein